MDFSPFKYQGVLFPRTSHQGVWPFNKESCPRWKNIQQQGHTAKHSSKLETSAPCVKIQNRKGSFIWKIINICKWEFFQRHSQGSQASDPEESLLLVKCLQFGGWPGSIHFLILRTKNPICRRLLRAPRSKHYQAQLSHSVSVLLRMHYQDYKGEALRAAQTHSQAVHLLVLNKDLKTPNKIISLIFCLPFSKESTESQLTVINT